MKKSIFGKLMVTYLVVIITSTIIFGVFFSILLRNHLIKTKEQELFVKGKQISLVANYYLQGLLSDQTLNYVLNSAEIFLDARVLVIDRGGYILALSGGAVPGFGRGKAAGRIIRGMQLLPKDTELVLKGSTVSYRGFSPYYGEPMLTVAIPVVSGQDSGNAQVIGAVFLNSPVPGVAEAVKDTYTLLLASFLAALAIASGLGLYLSRKISQPLREMNKAALAMARGDYKKKVEAEGDDEIGELAASFNYLAGELDLTIEALKEEKGKVELMLKSLFEGIIAVDKDGLILRINPAAAKLLKISEEDLFKLPISSLEGFDGLSGLFKDVLKSGSSGSCVFTVDKLTIRAYVSPIVSSRAILGSVGILQDISQAEQLEKMRRDFVANVSHELRAPLTVIRGYTEALLDEVIDRKEKPDKYYQIIRQETLRLERLIVDLLDLSRLQSGKVELDMESVDLETISRSVLEKFSPLAGEKQVQLTLLPDSSPFLVQGDGDRLEQLLIIFIDNALRHTNQGGKITISLRGEDQGARVRISDTGEGIPEEDLPYIWERFYKVDKAHTPSLGGTGLGLYIAREIVHLHGGVTRVESRPGEGAAFEFTLKKA
ncbi:MAG TPA: PAS domain-containing sensor histidine kinase [Desulfotomaculum sp.]|nr:MAG: Multi-sensor signal transduction histidine kinase [Desulfotomaculum sp. 46_80]HAG10275.1 PAS domain-containing sensor histidine kinase [Desulfotomaculum sp.]HBY03321.1 PAS domain-containing sensor histidine kinase [Desulfotomaculum sp.]